MSQNKKDIRVCVWCYRQWRYYSCAAVSKATRAET